MGLRLDGCSYSDITARFWEHISPTVSLSYKFLPSWAVNIGAGMYHQLPPYTALGYKDENGQLANKSLEYMHVKNAALGVEWTPGKQITVSLEGFYKHYTDIPLSVADNIPLSCKGNDYGVVGNELLVSSAKAGLTARSTMRWQIPGKLVSMASFTLFKSQYKNNSDAGYINSAWDNRFIANVSATYELPRNWSIGAKLSAIGGVRIRRMTLKSRRSWRHGTHRDARITTIRSLTPKRLDAFAQLDIRVDKNYYFKGWMLGFYLDIQNITKSVLSQPDVLMSTGVIENPDAPAAEQRYKMKYISQDSALCCPASA